MKQRNICILAVSGFAATFGVNQAIGQESIRVADSLPTSHYITRYATKFWMDEVTKRSQGQVTFEHFPAQQLGKAEDMLELARTGVADVTYVPTSYVSEKLPLSSVSELPGSFATSCEGSRAFLDLATNEESAARNEFLRNGVRVVYALALPPYQLMTAKRKYTGGMDAQGLKIRIPGGGALDALVRALGAVPLQIGSPELHESLARGTIDGLLYPYGSVFTYDLQGLLEYSTVGENFGTAMVTYVINEERWKALKPEMQQLLTVVGRETTERACRMMDNDVADFIKKFEEVGVTLVALSEAASAELDELNVKIADTWAEELDGRGLAARETLAAFRQALGKPD